MQQQQTHWITPYYVLRSCEIVRRAKCFNRWKLKLSPRGCEVEAAVPCVFLTRWGFWCLKWQFGRSHTLRAKYGHGIFLKYPDVGNMSLLHRLKEKHKGRIYSLRYETTPDLMLKCTSFSGFSNSVCSEGCKKCQFNLLRSAHLYLIPLP